MGPWHCRTFHLLPNLCLYQIILLDNRGKQRPWTLHRVKLSTSWSPSKHLTSRQMGYWGSVQLKSSMVSMAMDEMQMVTLTKSLFCFNRFIWYLNVKCLCIGKACKRNVKQLEMSATVSSLVASVTDVLLQMQLLVIHLCCPGGFFVKMLVLSTPLFFPLCWQTVRMTRSYKLCHQNSSPQVTKALDFDLILTPKCYLCILHQFECSDPQTIRLHS